MTIFTLNPQTNQGAAYGGIAALVIDYPELSKDMLYKRYQRLKKKSMPFYVSDSLMIWKLPVIRKPNEKLKT